MLMISNKCDIYMKVLQMSETKRSKSEAHDCTVAHVSHSLEGASKWSKTWLALKVALEISFQSDANRNSLPNFFKRLLTVLLFFFFLFPSCAFLLHDPGEKVQSTMKAIFSWSTDKSKAQTRDNPLFFFDVTLYNHGFIKKKEKKSEWVHSWCKKS